jgi:DNA polymerase delta subunit 1
MYYQTVPARPFLKIVLSLPTLVAGCRSMIEGGISLSWLGCQLRGVTYESNVLYPLRFMVDCSVVGGNWVELPAGQYRLTPAQARQSHCQLEAHLRWDALVSHAPEGEWAKLAPFRILSLDIECQGRKVGLHQGALLFFCTIFLAAW